MSDQSDQDTSETDESEETTNSRSRRRRRRRSRRSNDGAEEGSDAEGEEDTDAGVTENVDTGSTDGDEEIVEVGFREPDSINASGEETGENFESGAGEPTSGEASADDISDAIGEVESEGDGSGASDDVTTSTADAARDEQGHTPDTEGTSDRDQSESRPDHEDGHGHDQSARGPSQEAHQFRTGADAATSGPDVRSESQPEKEPVGDIRRGPSGTDESKESMADTSSGVGRARGASGGHQQAQQGAEGEMPFDSQAVEGEDEDDSEIEVNVQEVGDQSESTSEEIEAAIEDVESDDMSSVIEGNEVVEVDESDAGAFKLTSEKGLPDPDVHSLTLTRREVGDLLSGYRTVEIKKEYWLKPPFSMAVILYNSRKDEHEYYVVEPDLNDDEQILLEELDAKLREKVLYRLKPPEDEDENVQKRKAELIEKETRRLIDEIGVTLSEASIEKILYYLRRNRVRYGKLDPFMQDPNLEEVSVNGPGTPVFVYHQKYENIKTNRVYDEDELDMQVKRLAQQSGKDISRADPLLGTNMVDGSRIQLSLNDEVTARGSTITIRKFSETPFSPIDLLNLETFSLDQMAYLWLLIQEGHNCLVVGGTASGKTTTLNVLTMFIPPGKKVITIEDTREIQLPHENWIPHTTREGFDSDEGGILMYELLRASLRERPDHLIVGEVRGTESGDAQGDEANTLFQAMSTGHHVHSTFHADSVQTAIRRLNNPPLNVEKGLISGLDAVVVQQETKVDETSVRRARSINEIVGVEDRPDQEGVQINVKQSFTWDPDSDTFEAGGSDKLDDLRERGIDPEESIRERMRVLKYLAQNGITGYSDVTQVLRAYMLSPDAVMEQIENGKLDFEALSELQQAGINENANGR